MEEREEQQHQQQGGDIDGHDEMASPSQQAGRPDHQHPEGQQQEHHLRQPAEDVAQGNPQLAALVRLVDDDVFADAGKEGQGGGGGDGGQPQVLERGVGKGADGLAAAIGPHNPQGEHGADAAPGDVVPEHVRVNRVRFLVVFPLAVVAQEGQDVVAVDGQQDHADADQVKSRQRGLGALQPRHQHHDADDQSNRAARNQDFSPGRRHRARHGKGPLAVFGQKEGIDGEGQGIVEDGHHGGDESYQRLHQHQEGDDHKLRQGAQDGSNRAGDEPVPLPPRPQPLHPDDEPFAGALDDQQAAHQLQNGDRDLIGLGGHQLEDVVDLQGRPDGHPRRHQPFPHAQAARAGLDGAQGGGHPEPRAGQLEFHSPAALLDQLLESLPQVGGTRHQLVERLLADAPGGEVGLGDDAGGARLAGEQGRLAYHAAGADAGGGLGVALDPRRAFFEEEERVPGRALRDEARPRGVLDALDERRQRLHLLRGQGAQDVNAA